MAHGVHRVGVLLVQVVARSLDLVDADFLSVITQFDGLMFTLRDGQGGKDLQQNGTGIATGAVLAMSD